MTKACFQIANPECARPRALQRPRCQFAGNCRKLSVISPLQRPETAALQILKTCAGIGFALIVLCLTSAAAEIPTPAHSDDTFTVVFRQTNQWVAGDVATSVPLSDGRVLWLFGDSYIGQFEPASGTLPALFNARNAAWLQSTNDPLHPQTLCNFGGQDKSLFRPPPAAGDSESRPWFWPASGFQMDRTVYVYLTKLAKTPEGGMWGFKNVGQYWAKMSFPGLKVTGYVELPGFNGIQFACGFVQDEGSRFTYAFGNKRHGTASDVYVARFLAKRPETNWTFWDGHGWSADVTNAAVIAQGASTSANVCRVNGKFLLVTTQFSVACDQGREIYLSESGSPAGPFSPRQRIFTVDDAVNGHHPFFYMAEAHPEFINANGLLITYCINGYEPCVPTTVHGRMNPDFYRPRAIRLPLK